jgi:hypothetical protein
VEETSTKMYLQQGCPTHVPRYTSALAIFFEEVMNRTLFMVFVMTYSQGVPRLKKG